MQLAILSDIHGNLSALTAVLYDLETQFHADAIALLGDYIDYGMRSNEVIESLQRIDIPLQCVLWGNHEDAILYDRYERFSAERGVASAKLTKQSLSAKAVQYLQKCAAQDGKATFSFAGKHVLAVHGNLQDTLWGTIKPASSLPGYEPYDYVLSGHSHIPHIFPVFYECDNKNMRNKKRTLFINPGSVGQPRNHDNRAQYAVLDTDAGVTLRAVPYDIAYEQQLFPESQDCFYRDRLATGI